MMNIGSASTANTDLALKLVAFATVTALIAFLAYQLKMLIVCVILATTIASAIAPVAEAGERRRIPRLLTVCAFYLLAGAIYTAAATLLAPTVTEQWQKLSANMPSYLTGLNNLYASTFSAVSDHAQLPSLTANDVTSLGIRVLHQTLGMTAGFVGLILNTILTLFLAAYFVVEANKIWPASFRWMPPEARLTMSGLIGPLSSRLGGYVRGQLLVALVVATFLAVGFSLIGVKYALVLGILAGILNLVPYVGSVIACAFAAVVAFNQTSMLGVLVLLLYAFEQWVESAVFVPFFLGRHAGLHPLVVLLSIIVGGTLLGVPGALISVPVATVGLYLGEVFYASRLSVTPEDSRGAIEKKPPIGGPVLP